MSGKLDGLKGKAKEAVGDVTDDQGLKREGQADQVAGKVKEKLTNAKDTVQDKLDDVKDKAKTSVKK